MTSITCEDDNQLHPQVQLVTSSLLRVRRAKAFCTDPAVDDDAAAVGVGSPGGILLGHEHREAIAILGSRILSMVWMTDRRQPDRGLVDC
jgi:hypothetical protein